MTSGNLTAGDVLALTGTRDNGGFLSGNAGGILALIIVFILLFGGNGVWGGNGNVNQMATADLLYNQSTDSAIRGLAQGQCNIIDTVLNANYNNLLASKDISNQISSQTLALTSAMQNNTNAILTQMNNNVINDLRDRLDVTRGELSNVRQTAQITENILGNLATTAPKPPCYYNYGCGCGSLY